MNNPLKNERGPSGSNKRRRRSGPRDRYGAACNHCKSRLHKTEDCCWRPPTSKERGRRLISGISHTWDARRRGWVRQSKGETNQSIASRGKLPPSYSRDDVEDRSQKGGDSKDIGEKYLVEATAKVTELESFKTHELLEVDALQQSSEEDRVHAEIDKSLSTRKLEISLQSKYETDRDQDKQEALSQSLCDIVHEPSAANKHSNLDILLESILEENSVLKTENKSFIHQIKNLENELEETIAGLDIMISKFKCQRNTVECLQLNLTKNNLELEGQNKKLQDNLRKCQDEMRKLKEVKDQTDELLETSRHENGVISKGYEDTKLEIEKLKHDRLENEMKWRDKFEQKVKQYDKLQQSFNTISVQMVEQQREEIRRLTTFNASNNDTESDNGACILHEDRHNVNHGDARRSSAQDPVTHRNVAIASHVLTPHATQALTTTRLPHTATNHSVVDLTPTFVSRSLERNVSNNDSTPNCVISTPPTPSRSMNDLVPRHYKCSPRELTEIKTVYDFDPNVPMEYDQLVMLKFSAEVTARKDSRNRPQFVLKNEYKKKIQESKGPLSVYMAFRLLHELASMETVTIKIDRQTGKAKFSSPKMEDYEPYECENFRLNRLSRQLKGYHNAIHQFRQCLFSCHNKDPRSLLCFNPSFRIHDVRTRGPAVQCSKCCF